MATLTSKIQALLTYANGISGKADTTLGDAVKSLGDGYSGGINSILTEYGIPKVNLALAERDYTFVDYLMSDANSYIDTGLFASYRGCTIIYSRNKVGFIFGSREGSQIKRVMSIVNSTGGNTEDYYINNIIKTSETNPLKRTFVIYSNNTNDYNTKNIYLFTVNNNGSPFLGSYCDGTYIYLYAVKGRQFMLPCIRKSDSTPLMLDLITMTEYTNQGTGQFSYGEEKTLEYKLNEVNYKED